MIPPLYLHAANGTNCQSVWIIVAAAQASHALHSVLDVHRTLHMKRQGLSDEEDFHFSPENKKTMEFK